MASTKRIDLFIRLTSSVTKQGAIDYAYNRSNQRDNDSANFDASGNKINAHYYDVTDFRDGSKYMVFGDDAKEILQLNTSHDLITPNDEADLNGYMKGFTDEVIVNDDSGTATVALDSLGSYNVLVTVKDSLRAIARVEDETDTSFKIVIYDAETFAEDKVKLDCSNESVTVNYCVVYE